MDEVEPACRHPAFREEEWASGLRPWTSDLRPQTLGIWNSRPSNAYVGTAAIGCPPSSARQGCVGRRLLSAHCQQRLNCKLLISRASDRVFVQVIEKS